MSQGFLPFATDAKGETLYDMMLAGEGIAGGWKGYRIIARFQYISPVCHRWREDKWFTLCLGERLSSKSTLGTIAGRNTMYEPTQEIIVAEVRLRGTAQVADIAHILGPGFASLIPYELHRMKETGLIVYDEPLGPDSVLRFPQA